MFLRVSYHVTRQMTMVGNFYTEACHGKTDFIISRAELMQLETLKEEPNDKSLSKQQENL